MPIYQELKVKYVADASQAISQLDKLNRAVDKSATNAEVSTKKFSSAIDSSGVKNKLGDLSGSASNVGDTFGQSFSPAIMLATGALSGLSKAALGVNIVPLIGMGIELASIAKTSTAAITAETAAIDINTAAQTANTASRTGLGAGIAKLGLAFLANLGPIMIITAAIVGIGMAFKAVGDKAAAAATKTSAAFDRMKQKADSIAKQEKTKIDDFRIDYPGKALPSDLVESDKKLKMQKYFKDQLAEKNKEVSRAAFWEANVPSKDMEDWLKRAKAERDSVKASYEKASRYFIDKPLNSKKAERAKEDAMATLELHKIMMQRQTNDKFVKQDIEAEYDKNEELAYLAEKGITSGSQVQLVMEKYFDVRRKIRTDWEKAQKESRTKSATSGWNVSIMKAQLGGASPEEVEYYKAYAEYKTSENTQENYMKFLLAKQSYLDKIAEKKKAIADKQQANFDIERGAAIESSRITMEQGKDEYVKKEIDSWFNLGIEYERLASLAKGGEDVVKRWGLALQKYYQTLADVKKEKQKKAAEDYRKQAGTAWDEYLIGSELMGVSGRELDLRKAAKEFEMSDKSKLAQMQNQLAVKNINDKWNDEEKRKTNTLAGEIQQRIDLIKNEAKERIKAHNDWVMHRRKSETGFTSLEGISRRTAESGLASRYNRMLIPEAQDRPTSTLDIKQAIDSINAGKVDSDKYLAQIVTVLNQIKGNNYAY